MSAAQPASAVVHNKPVSGKTTVVVHPLVLLSVVDHYNRKEGSKKSNGRAVGILLGSWKGQELDIANSFAVPFEEDDKNPEVWFLDHDYLANMFAMFRKVNARERIVGWYHTGPKLRGNDILINELIRRFVPNPILVVIDAQPKELGLPTRAYVAVEEIHDDGTPASKTFEHVTSEIGAEEAEEVGVEHLLRDIRDIGQAGTLTSRIQQQLGSLRGLQTHLQDIREYLGLVVEKKLPISHQISYLLQDIFNLLPNLDLDDFIRSLTVKTSDSMLVVYLASVIRSTLALHNLINNMLENQKAEDDTKKEKKVDETKDKEKSKDSKDKKTDTK